MSDAPEAAADEAAPTLGALLLGTIECGPSMAMVRGGPDEDLMLGDEANLIVQTIINYEDDDREFIDMLEAAVAAAPVPAPA